MENNIKRILLVEDDGAMANTIEYAFDSKGFQIIKAYSYISALGKWNEYKGEFDYIILDQNIGVQGMKNELVNEYYPFIGMAFWNDIVNSCSRQDIVLKTFVYTGYKTQLERKANEKNWNIKDLQIISKTPDSIQRLIDKIVGQ